MDTTKVFWDRCARFYGAIQERSNRRLYRELAEMCLPYLRKDMAVLELACGSGQFTYPLCDRAGSWEASEKSVASQEPALSQRG